MFVSKPQDYVSNEKIALLASYAFIIIFCVTSACVGKRKISTSFLGLYKGDVLYEGGKGANYLLFKKKRRVKYMFRRVEDSKVVEKDIDTVGTVTKCRMNGDSIFFSFDSTYGGNNTISYTAFGKYYEKKTPTYNSTSKISYAGKWNPEGYYIFKVTEFRPKKIIYPNGTIVISGHSDTSIVYIEKYMKGP